MAGARTRRRSARYALRMTKALAERYAAHPAVVLWHVGNELGGGNGRCYCDESLAAFRGWLRDRYGSLDNLNRAWGTAFWGLYLTDWDHVPAPRGGEAHNPALLLDYDRFCSDSLLAHFRAERDVIREFAPTTPITTNFMVGPHQDVVDYPRWAEHVDVVANDHYTDPVRSAVGAGHRVLRGPDARDDPRPRSVAAHGALGQRPRLVPRQPGQGTP